MSENQKHKMTVKSIVVCIIIAFFIVAAGNTIDYLVRQVSQPPNADVVLEHLQANGFTDSHIVGYRNNRYIYVLDDTIRIDEANDNHFWIFIEKDINDEDMKYILSSVMYVFDKDFSFYDAEKILNLSKDDSPVKINNILYWPSFKNGKLSNISITM